MVLCDDKPSSIISAMIDARNYYANQRRVLQFILTSYLTIMISVCLTVCVYGETPFTYFHLLVVGIAIPTFCSSILAVGRPKGNELDSPPESKSGAFMTRVMWRNIIGQVIYQTVVILLLLTIGRSIFDIDYADSDPFYPTC